MKVFYQKIFCLIFLLGFTILPLPTKAVVVFKHEVVLSKNTPTTHIKKKPNRLATFLFKAYLKKAKKLNKEKVDKIIRTSLFVIIGVLLIFTLQGSIWLSILSGLTFLSIKLWQRIRNRNKEENEDDRTYANQNGRSYSTRSVYSFLWGLGLWFFSFLLPVLFPNAPAGIISLFFITFITGFVFFLISLVRAMKGIQQKEPNRVKAIVVLLLSLLLVLPLVVGLFSAL
jgi:putative Ca2+/H+ antiporter (TMEM165/GDT1 family)